MRKLTYTIHLEPAEEGGYTVTVPALPGCVTEGNTYAEAIEMARDAINLYLESLLDDGEEIPIEPPPHGAINLPLQIELAHAG